MPKYMVEKVAATLFLRHPDRYGDPAAAADDALAVMDALRKCGVIIPYSLDEYEEPTV